MGMQLNVGDHASPVAGYLAIPPGYRADAQWARTRARAVARGRPSANVYFKTLPGGKSLSALLADNTIWVNYSVSIGAYGEAVIGGRELAIGPSAFRMGRWTVLATLIHELAHINGAPGGVSRAAEQALVACGLGRASELRTGVDDPDTPYDPSLSG
ncbi:hypothetical protein ACFL5O_07330 [Myxococcota bacterium]